jgi:hypothetical protein
LEFTHSQSFETFVRCHIHAFRSMSGVARELWYDNLATAVAEHDGNLVRFHPRFLAFAREYSFFPRACHVRAAWEKGKIERAVGYLRQNFWPLRTFTDLTDVNSQARHWLQEVANQRRHRETGETPAARFQPETLRALPVMVPDYRDTAEALVHKDLRLSFDGNRYCAPPRYVGRHLTIKADASSVTLYDQYQEIVSYARCWQRGQTLGAERFQKELLAQLTAAQRSAEQQRLISWLGPASESYLRRLADTDRSLTRQVRELLLLVREYGPEAVAAAVTQAYTAGAFGADYIANLLRQQRMRRDVQPPLRFQNPQLLVRGLPTCDKERLKRQMPLSHNRCQCRKLLRSKSFRNGPQSIIETKPGLGAAGLRILRRLLRKLRKNMDGFSDGHGQGGRLPPTTSFDICHHKHQFLVLSNLKY